MRFSVQACIEGEGERSSRIVTVGVIERDDEFAPSSGLGRFMNEAKALVEAVANRLSGWSCRPVLRPRFRLVRESCCIPNRRI